eukprot:TRINITY_DN95542_c0_g1_i1.p1 TRINITY_DN95542_c0_g1~~TRINITY_DN95542_c0_g1_i1.p1  ORF type:complete len:163 (-),score=26.43 TRINITY_DN95542_c0_g1_i1:426-914(-)
MSTFLAGGSSSCSYASPKKATVSAPARQVTPEQKSRAEHMVACWGPSGVPGAPKKECPRSPSSGRNSPSPRCSSSPTPRTPSPGARSSAERRSLEKAKMRPRLKELPQVPSYEATMARSEMRECLARSGSRETYAKGPARCGRAAGEDEESLSPLVPRKLVF